jgi:hypothetical protein
MKVATFMPCLALVVAMLSGCATDCDKAREALESAQVKAIQWMRSDQFKGDVYESRRAAIEARYAEDLISYEEYQRQLRELGDLAETPAQYSLRLAEERVEETCGY